MRIGIAASMTIYNPLLADPIRIGVKVIFLPDPAGFRILPQIVHLASFRANIFLATIGFYDRLGRIQAKLASARASCGRVEGISDGFLKESNQISFKRRIERKNYFRRCESDRRRAEDLARVRVDDDPSYKATTVYRI